MHAEASDAARTDEDGEVALARGQVLAMGMYLLDILWAQADKQDEWLQVEHDLLAEFDGLARAAHDLEQLQQQWQACASTSTSTSTSKISSSNTADT